MSKELVFTIISSLLTLIGIGYLLTRYRALFMEAFRQDLFELRDEVFDFAKDGRIPFSHPSYALLRLTINGYIRFAHERTLWHGLVFTSMLSKEDKQYFDTKVSFKVRWAEATKGLDEDVKEQLTIYRDRMDSVAMRYFVLSAPECAAVLIVIFAINDVVSHLYRKGVGIRPRIEEWFSDTDNVALFYGEQSAIV